MNLIGENKCNAFLNLDSRRWFSTYQVIDTPLELRTSLTSWCQIVKQENCIAVAALLSSQYAAAHSKRK